MSTTEPHAPIESDEDRQFDAAKRMDAVFLEAKAKREEGELLESRAQGREDGSAGRADTAEDFARAQELKNEAAERLSHMEAEGHRAAAEYEPPQLREAREFNLEEGFESVQRRDSQDTNETAGP